MERAIAVGADPHPVDGAGAEVLDEDVGLRDEAVEQRDGARRVIAVTERFGIENIATDPNVRKQAKAVLAGDDVARREFALAKAEA